MIEALLRGFILEYSPFIVLVGCLTVISVFSNIVYWVIKKTGLDDKLWESMLLRKRPPVLPKALDAVQLGADGLNEIKSLIHKKDKLQLAVFMAVHQPTLKEIVELIATIQDQPPAKQSQLKKKNVKPDALAKLLKSLNFAPVKKEHLHTICEFDGSKTKIIDENFIAKFGNLLFMENFIMYDHLCRDDHAIYHIPKDNDLRRMFDTFADTGIAKHGSRIPISERLRIMNLDELQQVADELDIYKNFHSIDEAIETLATSKQTTGHFSSRYDSKDLFLLRREVWDIKLIEKEWSAYNACAEMLCAAPA